MRILRVIASTNPAGGGPIEGIRQISRVLERRGHSTVIASLDHPNAPWISGNELDVRALGPQTSMYFMNSKLMSWLLANAKSYDAVVQHGLWNGTVFSTWRAMSA